MISHPDFFRGYMIKVAQIINTHGLKGECKLYLVTDDPQHRFEKGRVLHLEDGRTLTVVRYREQKGFGYCYFEGIDSIEKAEQLKTKNLFIAQDDLPELEEGQYYYHELMNCTVYNEEKENLGEVVDILETGANLVLRVKSKNTSFLLPFVPAFIVNVNKDAHEIIIREMDGLR